MNNKRKKIIASFVFTALILLIGGFCDGDIVRADFQVISVNPMDMDDCSSGPANRGIQKEIPYSNTIMPCCIDNHDTGATIVRDAIQERVKFLQVGTEIFKAAGITFVEKKLYISSVSPPKEPDILSSVVKIE